MRYLALFEPVSQDLGYAIRALRRSPGFVVAVSLTLALGLGVNTAMFSLLDPILLRPPAEVAQADQLRRMYARVPGRAAPRLFGGFTYPQLMAMRARLAGTAPLAAYYHASESLSSGTGGVMPARAAYVTGNYFSLLHLRPEAGRFFGASDDRMGAGIPLVVLSDALWRAAFGADSGVIGTTVGIGAVRYTVVGIAPAGFTGVDLERTDIWLPLSMSPRPADSDGAWYRSQYTPILSVLARVPPGTDARALAAGATAAYRWNEPEDGRMPGASTVVAGPLLQARGPAERPHEISIAMRLAGISLLVLLIACANIANMLLVRAARRRREIAIRLALGISRRRLAAQLLTESLLLALAGAAAGLLVAVWAGSALRVLLLPGVEVGAPLVGHRVVLLLGGLALLAGLTAGIGPALQATRLDLTTALKSGARDGASHRSALRAGLLILQSALCVVLLAGAALLVSSLHNVSALDLGYDSDRLLFAIAGTPGARDHRAEITAAMREASRNLAGAPGVRSVALSSATPMAEVETWLPLSVPGYDSVPWLNGSPPAIAAVSPSFFPTAGVRVERGRPFTDEDGAGAAAVAIVNAAMARTLWPGEDPLGRCLMLRRGAPCSTVVGVVEDARQLRMIEPPLMQYFVPEAQAASMGFVPGVLLIRTADGQASEAGDDARRELKRLLPSGTPLRIERMSDILAPQLRPWRLGAELSTALGLLALVVAAIGFYGVVAFIFSQRTHEIGVRMALGADREDVLRLVLGAGCRLTAAGVAAGLLLTLALGRLVASLLYGVTPADPLVLAGAAAVVLGAGFGASAIPAWRAARVDPLAAIRAE